MENSEYMSFDLTQPDRVTIRIESEVVKGKVCKNRTKVIVTTKRAKVHFPCCYIGRILDGKTMLDLVTEYTSYAGRMLPLPDWVSEGAIASIQGGAQKTKEIIQKLRQNNVPLAAVFLQDWTGQRSQEAGRGVKYTRHWWNWESDDDLYPHWDKFVDQLANDPAGKIRVLSYVNPLLSNASPKPRFKRNLFPEAQDKGYLVKSTQSVSSDNQALSIKFGSDLEAGILDLTNPEARTWFKQVLKEQVWNSNISGTFFKIERLYKDVQRLMHLMG